MAGLALFGKTHDPMPRPVAAGSRTLFLVRHGETSWNAERRWQGGRDIGLAASGREQAAALALRLAGVPLRSAFSSDLSRARETAAIVLQGRLPVVEEPLLREMSYGAWEGVRDDEIGLTSPEERERWSMRPHECRPGGGESLEELLDRAWRGLAGCLERSEGDVLVVAHGGVNRVLLCRILGMPLSRFSAVDQAPTGVNELLVPPGPPADALLRSRIRRLNCTRHLAVLADVPARPLSR